MEKEEAKKNGTEAAEPSGAPASSKGHESNDKEEVKTKSEDKDVDTAAAEGKPPAPISKTEDKLPSSSSETNTAKTGPSTAKTGLSTSSETNILKTGPPTTGVDTTSGGSLKTESPALTAKPVDREFVPA